MSKKVVLRRVVWFRASSMVQVRMVRRDGRRWVMHPGEVFVEPFGVDLEFDGRRAAYWGDARLDSSRLEPVHCPAYAQLRCGRQGMKVRALILGQIERRRLLAEVGMFNRLPLFVPMPDPLRRIARVESEARRRTGAIDQPRPRS